MIKVADIFKEFNFKSMQGSSVALQTTEQSGRFFKVGEGSESIKQATRCTKTQFYMPVLCVSAQLLDLLYSTSAFAQKLCSIFKF